MVRDWKFKNYIKNCYAIISLNWIIDVFIITNITTGILKYDFLKYFFSVQLCYSDDCSVIVILSYAITTAVALIGLLNLG